MNTFRVRKHNENRKRYVSHQIGEFKFLSCGFGTGMTVRDESYFSMTSSTEKFDFRLEVDLETAKRIYSRLQDYFKDKIVNSKGVEL